MIVTAGTGYSQTKETASDHVDAVMPFIGAGYFHRAVVVVPGTQTEKAGCGQGLIARLLIEQVTGELRLDEGVVG